MTQEIKDKIVSLLGEAIRAAVAAGELPPETAGVCPVIEVPKDRAHGDFASNLALMTAKSARRPPRQVAELLVKNLPEADDYIDRVEVAGPGFINFFLSRSWLFRVVEEIRRRGGAWGRSGYGGGKRVLVEFVSANPTGPLNVVSARAAAVGDTLARLLEAAGYDADREYYINDAGAQVLKLGRSLEARVRELMGQEVEFPEDGYPGEYLIDIAREYLSERGGLPQDSPADMHQELADYAIGKILAQSRQLLEEYGLVYDRWFSERQLRDSGGVEEALRALKDRGHTYEENGATWFRSTAFGDDKDRVLVKNDGSYTYLLPDIAYHWDKFRRGYEHLIDILGPDHHGYIGRLKAAAEALGYTSDALEVMIVQVVRLVRGGEPVRMSKRGGAFIPMSELLEEVGRDAARFFFLMRSPDSHLDFDIDLALVQGNENPVYYVQYAHARICSILRLAEERGYALPPADEAVASLLEEQERALIRRLADFPEEVLEAGLAREPHRITRYAQEIATLFHSFYTDCRVLGDDPKLSADRLALCDATRITLYNCLELLGVSAPEQM